MMDKQQYMDIPDESFELVGSSYHFGDKKLQTKPVSYFKDVLNRFARNKSSVVAAFIILALVLYAVFVPMFCETNYSRSLTDTMYLNYTKLPPKSDLFGWLGLNGIADETVNTVDWQRYKAIEIETGLKVVLEEKRMEYTDATGSAKSTYCDIVVDQYTKMGMMQMTLTPEQFEDIQAWQDKTGIQVIFPAITDASQSDANIWYDATKKKAPKLDKEGNFVAIYKTTTKTDTAYHSIRIAADNDPEKPFAYARVTGTSDKKAYVCRVCRYTYFQYRYGSEPSFVLGTNDKGQDILTRLASGARFSFILAICVSMINLFIGAIYGSIEGYYGGAVDLVMERICDVLGGIPFTVATVLFQLHLSKSVGVVGALVFAFILTGWMGMAGRVRMQFYRFKRQEFVMAARTLGASDKRLMFKHIFPNSLGTIITGTVLVIPGVIFSESSLTYLGIVNLESSTMTSVGTMLANGKAYLSTFPHIILFPSLFISLLEISFNLLGNGLRDAFNPSLRGAE